ncbi:MAG: serine/threonine protein kinase [Planctomycetales bacterium]|nr:serine/threonine protein kinase [Planctomycetales bacterium]
MLGSGGQAEVYLANDTTLDRQVAIKISKPDRPLSQEEQEQFKQEAKKIAGLKHPGIVTVHDFGIHNDGRCFIVLEYLPGQSLKECLRNPESRKTLTIERILDLVIRVAEALHFAHQQGVYHRDLKPGNILLDEHGNPRISDFGLAVTQETQRHLEGQIAGTVPYMSPEQVRGESHCLNGQTDIWALGVILYELFTGRRPFQGSSESEVKKEILHRTPTPLRQWNDEVPQAVEDVVLRCLENDVGRRYPTAGDVGTALREMSANYKKQNAPHVPTAELSSKVLLERELAPPIPKTRLRTIMVFACLILLAVATGIIAFATIAPKDSDRRLQPEKWNNVLRWEPEELAAAGPQPVEPEWTYHTKARKVTFATNRRTLLSLANVDSPDFDYRVRLKQTPWNGNGNIGIFFGYNVNEVGGSHVAKYQAITIEWNGAASQIPLSIDRSLFFDPLTDGGPPGRRTYLHSMRLIPPSFNDKPPVLLISIRANRVVRIQLNDLQFPELASPRLEGIVLEQTSFAYAGIIGLYLSGAPEGSSGEFLSAEVFPRRSESAP